MSNLRAVTAPLPFAVVVIDDDPRLRTRLAMQLGDVARTASFASVEAMLAKVVPGPLIVVFGPSFAPGRLSEVADFLGGRPDVSAVLVVAELSTALLQAAIRTGVSDVITIPDDASQVVESVRRVAEQVRNGAALAGSAGIGRGGPASLGRVLTVFSTKGGAGKSFVATNLAVILAMRAGGSVMLVDADLQFGDAAVMLRLTPEHTVADAIGAIARLDPPLLRSLVVRHDASGLLVLPAPTEPAFADQVKADDVIHIIDVARRFCSFVVVDTPTYFTEVVIRLLEESDDIVMVAGMDVPNIKNMKIGLHTLRLLNVSQSKVKLVINRANSKVKIDVGEVERALGLRADVLVPSDISVPHSVNKGVPAVLDAPRSGVARSMEALADLFSVRSTPQRGRG